MLFPGLHRRKGALIRVSCEVNHEEGLPSPSSFSVGGAFHVPTEKKKKLGENVFAASAIRRGREGSGHKLASLLLTSELSSSDAQALSALLSLRPFALLSKYDNLP